MFDNITRQEGRFEATPNFFIVELLIKKKMKGIRDPSSNEMTRTYFILNLNPTIMSGRVIYDKEVVLNTVLEVSIDISYVEIAKRKREWILSNCSSSDASCYNFYWWVLTQVKKWSWFVSEHWKQSISRTTLLKSKDYLTRGESMTNIPDDISMFILEREL